MTADGIFANVKRLSLIICINDRMFLQLIMTNVNFIDSKIRIITDKSNNNH